MEKLVPKLRFPEFNEIWTSKQLSDVVNYTKGYAFKSEDYQNNGIRIVRVSDLSSDKIKNDNDKIYIDKLKSINYAKYLLNKGDIIITTVGSKPEMIESAVGRGILVYNDNEGLLNQNMLKFENSNTTINGFLIRLINTPKYHHYVKSIARGNANQSNITVENLLEYKICLPSLPEQQKIASFLTSVDERIALLEKQKQGLETYKKGVMQQLFSQQLRFKPDPNETSGDDAGKDFPDWEEKKLGEVSTITTGSSNRQDSGLDGEFTFFDRSEDIRTSNIYLFDTEAIIVAGEGSDFKPKYFIGKFDLHQRSYAIMNFKNSTGKFLFYYIHFHRNHFLSQAVGSTVKSLRLPMFQKMEIKLPCLDEQQKIATFLSAIDARIEVVSKQIEQSKIFKKGLLQQMFV